MNGIRKWLGILAVAVMSIAAFSTVQAAPSPHDLFLESESPLKYAETVETLKAELTADGWSILATHDLSASLAKKGFTVLPVTVIEGCRGNFSVELLKNEGTRYVSSLLPCRVSVYETSTGKVIISRMNTAVMGAQMEPAGAEVMGKAGKSLEAIVAKVLAKK